MSPVSPSRPKRRRTTLTAGPAPCSLDAPFAAANDQFAEAAPAMTSAETTKRKSRFQELVKCSPHPFPQQQQQQVAGAGCLVPPHAHLLQPCRGLSSTQSISIGVIPVYHRPTYRADLAKRGYLVRNSLGCGSYSKVKKALDSRRNFELTAVKIVDRVRAPRDYQEKFMPRELNLWPRLRHPNLIRFLDCFEDSQRVYMVLEYAEGGDALHYVQATGALGEERARVWTTQVASAVAYMHSLGVAHRDLKLENLLLTGDLCTIKICDFGFVRQSTDGIEMSQTFCGSKAYAAPEILQGRPYNPMKADIWALGVIMYIFVTGKMPFDETKGTKCVVEEQRTLELKWLMHRRPSPACHHLIRRTFTWDFTERPTARDVLLDNWLLDGLAQSSQLAVHQSSVSSLAPVVNPVNNSCSSSHSTPFTEPLTNANLTLGDWFAK